jgi:hypothetical protein
MTSSVFSIEAMDFEARAEDIQRTLDTMVTGDTQAEQAKVRRLVPRASSRGDPVVSGAEGSAMLAPSGCGSFSRAALFRR